MAYKDNKDLFYTYSTPVPAAQPAQNRPHSREKTVADGVAVVQKGTPVADTRSGGGGGGGSSPAPAAQNTEPGYVHDRTGVGVYDPAANAAYQDAMARLNQLKGNAPQYTNSYGGDVANAYAALTGRDPFSYDLDADMLYQQYRQRYTEQGQQAMMDTMGQAAALTGGYGSSYAQSVGQQQYDAYLQQLNDIVPSLYDRAYQQYRDEGSDLLQRYSLARDLEDTEYNRYRDTMSDYRYDMQDAQNAADTAYNRGLQENELAYQRWKDELSREQDYKGELMNMMSVLDYNPTDDDLARAGMDRSEADLWVKYIAQQKAGSGGGGGGGSASTPISGNGLPAAFLGSAGGNVTLGEAANGVMYTIGHNLYNAAAAGKNGESSQAWGWNKLMNAVQSGEISDAEAGKIADDLIAQGLLKEEKIDNKNTDPAHG